MTREEQIIAEAKKYYSGNIQCYDAFLHGTEFADERPINVWHTASESPLPNKDIIVAAYNDEHNRRDIWHISLTPDIIADFSRERNLLWAYVNDLPPSASCSEIPNNSSK